MSNNTDPDIRTSISAIIAYSSGGYGGVGPDGGVITGDLGVNTMRIKVPELFFT